MRGYKAIADWAQSLGPKARERLRCRRHHGRYLVPSESIVRNVLIRVDPLDLDRALQHWNQAFGQDDTTLAIDGKTMCNALDAQRPSNPCHERGRPSEQGLLHPKKSRLLLPKRDTPELKQTNEIGMAIPLLDSLDLKDKDITADALLTQRKLADYLVVDATPTTTSPSKPISPRCLTTSRCSSKIDNNPHFVTHDPPDHGRIETRKIWTTTALNSYLDFPHVAQAFAIERIAIDKKNRPILPRDGLRHHQPIAHTGRCPTPA